MRKLILLCLTVSSVFTYSQKDTIPLLKQVALASGSLADLYTPKPFQIVPASPQTGIFEQFVNHPVTEYYGLADISIPIYEIDIKGVKIPITLSYHAGGVKFLQYDGDMGAGWTIQAGGYKISRTVYGKCDFDYRQLSQRYTQEGFAAAQRRPAASTFYVDGYLSTIFCKTNDFEGLGGVRPANISLDGEYDQFTYMTPSTNGHFVVTPTGVDIIEQNPDIITINKDSATLIDASGIRYSFGGTSDNFKEYTNFTDNSQSLSNVTGWSLREIATPDNRKISFKYSRDRYGPEREYGRKKSLVVTDAPVYIPYGGILNMKYYFNSKIEWTNNVPYYFGNNYDINYLQEIETDKEIVVFERTPTNYKYSSFQYTNSSSLLSAIVIKDKQGNVRKKITFTYQTLPVGVATNSNTIPWHVLLSSVGVGNGSASEKKYTMEYHDPVTPSNAYPDFWGYYKYNVGKGVMMNLLSSFGEDNYISQTVQYGDNQSQVSTKINLNNRYRDYFVNRQVDSNGINAFSLKKITYPTGGYSEYFYEPNQNAATQAGGIRIKTIRSYPNSGGSPLVNHYVYGVNGSGKGDENFTFDESCFYELSYLINILREQPDIGHNEVHISAIKTYTEAPAGDLNWNLYKIFYPEVSVYRYNETQPQGSERIVSKYYSGDNYLTQDIISPQAILRHEYRSEAIPYYNKQYIVRYSMAEEPQLIRREIYNSSNQLVQKTECTYENPSGSIRSYEGLRILRRMYVLNHDTDIDRVYGENLDPRYAYNFITAFFDYQPYNIWITGKKKLLSQTTTLYQNGQNPIASTEAFSYNTKQQISKTTKTTNNSTPLEINYYYPHEYTDAISQQMTMRNILSPVIEQVSKNSGTEIGRIKTIYGNSTPVTSGFYLPVSVQTSSGGTLSTALSMDKYDSRGNLIQYTQQGGFKVSYVWGYNYQYPIAEIENAGLDEVTPYLSQATMDAIAVRSEPSSADWSTLVNLQSNLKTAKITLYKYKPLVGIIEMTDPSGLVTYYEYDSFNRLTKSSVKEGATMRTIETYNYNYKNR